MDGVFLRIQKNFPENPSVSERLSCAGRHFSRSSMFAVGVRRLATAASRVAAPLRAAVAAAPVTRVLPRTFVTLSRPVAPMPAVAPRSGTLALPCTPTSTPARYINSRIGERKKPKKKDYKLKTKKAAAARFKVLGNGTIKFVFRAVVFVVSVAVVVVPFSSRRRRATQVLAAWPPAQLPGQDAETAAAIAAAEVRLADPAPPPEEVPSLRLLRLSLASRACFNPSFRYRSGSYYSTFLSLFGLSAGGKRVYLQWPPRAGYNIVAQVAASWARLLCRSTASDAA
jgi:hypothetical protein